MTDTNSADEIRRYRGQLQAIEMCRAVSGGDPDAAKRMYATEKASELDEEIASALTTFAVSLARTVAANDDTLTETSIWDGLANRAETGLLGTAEIDEITNPKENDQ